MVSQVEPTGMKVLDRQVPPRVSEGCVALNGAERGGVSSARPQLDTSDSCAVLRRALSSYATNAVPALVPALAAALTTALATALVTPLVTPGPLWRDNYTWFG